MSKKKLVSLALVYVMVFMLAVPAFASNASPGNIGDNTPERTTGNSSEITGKYEEIPINVTISTIGEVILNPYGLPYDVTKSNGAKITVSGQQFVSTTPTYVSNLSKVDLNVSISGTVQTQGSLMLSNTEVAKTATMKQANVRLEVMQIDATTGEAKLQKVTDNVEAAKVGDAVLEVLADNSLWTAANGVQSVTLAMMKASIANPVLLVAPQTYAAEVTQGDVDAGLADATSGEIPFAYNVGSVAIFRVTGTMASNPTMAWSKGATTGGGDDGTEAIPADGFKATIVFTFAPADN